MSMELGTYSQGDYVPRKITEQPRVLGSTALEFSSLGEERLPYDTSIISVIDDPDMYAAEQDVEMVPDIQLPKVHDRQEFGLLMRALKSSRRRRGKKRGNRG